MTTVWTWTVSNSLSDLLGESHGSDDRVRIAQSWCGRVRDGLRARACHRRRTVGASATSGKAARSAADPPHHIIPPLVPCPLARLVLVRGSSRHWESHDVSRPFEHCHKRRRQEATENGAIEVSEVRVHRCRVRRAHGPGVGLPLPAVWGVFRGPAASSATALSDTRRQQSLSPALGARRAAFDVRRSAFGVRRSAFGARRSAQQHSPVDAFR